MRKVSILIGFCLLTALALTLWAQSEADLPPIMKDVAASNNSLRMSLMNGAAEDVAKDAAKLQGDFTKAAGIFKALKAQDAVDAAKANADAAGEVIKAAKANNLDAAKAPAKTIQGSCKSCHDNHREQLPDKTYKFK
jgi:hypothetical protein